MNSLQVILISGKQGDGKSTLLQEIVRSPGFGKYNFSGIIAKGILNQDGTKDFVLHDILTNYEIHFASKDHDTSYINYGSYFFNPDAIQYGEKILSKALSEKVQVIILDEIGPMELNHTIWYNSLVTILKSFKGVLILTIRESLIEQVLETFQINPAAVYSAQITNRNEIVSKISEILSLST